MTMSDGGKGSGRRPGDGYSDGWDRIFGKGKPAPDVRLETQPEQAETLTGCNCRWSGDLQVKWCGLHLAHKEALHEWAERAKAAEAKLGAPQP